MSGGDGQAPPPPQTGIEALIVGGARAPRKLREWIPAFEEFCTDVPEEDFTAALERAIRDHAGKDDRTNVAKKGDSPVCIVLFGPPGAGKTTIVHGVSQAAGLRIGRNYVTLDYDALDKYYPTYDKMMNVPGFVSRRPLGVGFAHAHMCPQLNDFTVALGDAMVDHFVGRRANLAIVSHRPSFLIQARLSGYRSVFVYVGAPKKTVIARAHKRAIDTGFLLAPTLAAQDSYVEALWEDYVRSAPWYALWSDFFVAVNNAPELKGSMIKDSSAREMSVYEMAKEKTSGGLEPQLVELYRRVCAVSGIGPGQTPLPSLPKVGNFLMQEAGISPLRKDPRKSHRSIKGSSAASRKVYYRGGDGSKALTYESPEAAITAIDPSNPNVSAVVVRAPGVVIVEEVGTEAPAEDVAALKRKWSAEGSPNLEASIVAIVWGRGEGTLPPVGSEIATAASISAAAITAHNGGRWTVSPGSSKRSPCVSSPVCLRLLTEMPWAERLHAWDQLEGMGGARIAETYPKKAMEFGFSARWTASTP
jgi:hypothetical protein